MSNTITMQTCHFKIFCVNFGCLEGAPVVTVVARTPCTMFFGAYFHLFFADFVKLTRVCFLKMSIFEGILHLLV